MTCVALGWLSGCVVAASCSSSSTEPASLSPAAAAAASAAVASAAATGLDLSRGAGVGIKCQLLLFPRNHLDFSSVVASTTLNKVRAFQGLRVCWWTAGIALTHGACQPLASLLGACVPHPCHPTPTALLVTSCH